MAVKTDAALLWDALVMPRAVFGMNAIERRAFFGYVRQQRHRQKHCPTTAKTVFATAVFVHSALRCSATSLFLEQPDQW